MLENIPQQSGLLNDEVLPLLDRCQKFAHPHYFFNCGSLIEFDLAADPPPCSLQSGRALCPVICKCSFIIAQEHPCSPEKLYPV